ncbi:MAG: hypothetical protein AAFP90_11220 [Planctomycetota bacterium]
MAVMIPATRNKHQYDLLSTASVSLVSFTITLIVHEGAHVLACLIVGGDFQQFSLTFVRRPCEEPWQFRIVAAAGTLANLATALACVPLMLFIRQRSSFGGFVAWLFVSFNTMIGIGYLFASGLTGVGDWAVVVSGLPGEMALRLALAIGGGTMLLAAVFAILRSYCQLIPDKSSVPSQQLMFVAYGTCVVWVTAIGAFQLGGGFSRHAVMGFFAAAGGLSPLLWMMQWLQSSMFRPRGERAFEIPRSLIAYVASFIAVGLTIAASLLNR